MVRVFPLTDEYAERFGKMFADYYDELGCDEDAGHLVREYVLPDLLAGLLRVDLIEEDAASAYIRLTSRATNGTLRTAGAISARYI